MKKVMLACMMCLYLGAADAQAVVRDAQIKPADKPVNNPNQLPNYYQNNSSYSNNSMQNNKPANPNGTSFPGNGNYTDPTRTPSGTYFGGNIDQLPQQGPVNSTNSSGVHAATGR